MVIASHDRNIVRDRTLVLRVLVPGLHTSLRDKINAKNNEDDKPGTPASTAAAASSGMGGSAGQQRMSADQLLNLDGVTCMPSKIGSTLWHFRYIIWTILQLSAYSASNILHFASQRHHTINLHVQVRWRNIPSTARQPPLVCSLLRVILL